MRDERRAAWEIWPMERHATLISGSGRRIRESRAGVLRFRGERSRSHERSYVSGWENNPVLQEVSGALATG